MARLAGAGARLTKIKSALKRLPSIGKLARTNSINAAADDENLKSSATVFGGGGEGDLRQVYVGRSRRLYLVEPSVIEHPVFQELLQRSAAAGGEYMEAAEQGPVNVACEVVLFEHLLWMLQENAQSHNLDCDLVDFYTC